MATSKTKAWVYSQKLGFCIKPKTNAWAIESWVFPALD